jgi:hypothetical protein
MGGSSTPWLPVPRFVLAGVHHGARMRLTSKGRFEMRIVVRLD